MEKIHPRQIYLPAWISVHISASMVCNAKLVTYRHSSSWHHFSSHTLFGKNRADLWFFTQQYFTKSTHSLNVKFLEKCVSLRKDSCCRWEWEGRKSFQMSCLWRGLPLTSIFLARIKHALVLICNRNDFSKLDSFLRK